MPFLSDSKSGEVGEQVVWNLFIKMKTVRNVIDVRDDEYFRKVDVDFLIETSGRQFVWLEVKTDSMAARTGNMAYEVLSNKNFNTLGCLEKTAAGWIAYYVPDANKVYLMDAKKLRSHAHSGRYSEVSMGDQATGFLIPLRALYEAHVILKTYEV